jgi:hypothetical protein
MAIDSRIALALDPINIGQRFGQNIQNLRNVDLLNQQRALAPLQQEQAQLKTDLLRAQQPAQMQQAIQQIGINTAQQLKPLFDSGNTLGVISGLTSTLGQLTQAGAPETVLQSIRDDIAQAQTPEGFEQLKAETESALSQAAGQQGVAVRSSAPIVDPETGQVSIPTFDPNTQTTKLVPVEGARQLTPAQKQQQELGSFQKKERVKARISRSKEIKKELGDRNRSAARSQQPLFEALRLASNPRTAEGLGAGIKSQLARVLPGVDVTNEGNLDSALNRLALEQLQNFKGPTTDFEFGVTQNIVGSLTNPREANIARLKSLQRANWFAKREFKQFKEFSEGGGEPDDFAFDFNEVISTKKGDFELKDLQDTAVDNNLTIEEVIERLNK